jgi:succinoglycan biosynthesis protein ExoA
MSDESPFISVVVPCRNEQDYIEPSIHLILAQEPPPGGFEIIVADGMSGDGTRAILKRLTEEYPRLQVIDNFGRIAATGLNAAIRMAQGNIIIRMDVHTEYAPDYICQCLAVLQETHADNVGGPWIAKGNGFVGRAIAAAFQSPFSVGGARGRSPDYEGPLDTVYLGCWPREVFDQIGLFDEDLVRSEDDELNLRIARAGGRIWQSPRIKSRYHPRESLGALFRQCMQDGYWKVRVIQKHRLPASVRHLIPACFVLSLSVLPLVSLLWPMAVWGWLGLLGIYSLCNIAASVLTAVRQGLQFLPLLLLVFPSYHFGYGYGFVRGLWDSVILRRGPTPSYTKLTRTATNNASLHTVVGRQKQAIGGVNSEPEYRSGSLG